MDKSTKREILKAMIARYSNLKITENQLYRSIHSDKKDMKSIALGIYDQLGNELKKKSPNDKVVQYLCYRAIKIWMNETQGNMSKNEVRIVRQVAESCLADYYFLPFDEKLDYNAMRIGCEFAYQALLQGISDEQVYNAVTLHVDTNDILISWDLHSGVGDEDFEISWKSLNLIFNEKQIQSNIYYSFEASSIEMLATAKFQEQQFSTKSPDLIAYNGLILTYTGVFEHELGIILKLYNKTLNVNRMGLRKMSNYVIENKIKYLENFDHGKLNDLINFRNNAAHGRKSSKDEFDLVINTLINQQYLKDLCLAKQALLDGERIIKSGAIKDFEEMATFLGTPQGEKFIKEFHESDVYKEASKQLEEAFNIKTKDN
ncbi:hypothetical protein [Priestia endophytica]|uniref:hypothetical protein n=1 Tax=Priestia endophytica TaxID=135735 RepID=UPI000F52E480|nr:hypothetical protein [Priestia endophytica]RPK08294.1 hypothetical protein FH5_04924 [Priestia endophytica]